MVTDGQKYLNVTHPLRDLNSKSYKRSDNGSIKSNFSHGLRKIYNSHISTKHDENRRFCSKSNITVFFRQQFSLNHLTSVNSRFNISRVISYVGFIIIKI